jgi:hypothetical protein
MTTMTGIPTQYRGVNFRSRLEARWAAFFDLLHWDWQYEPLDLAGWIPDFAVWGISDHILVEIKPVTGLEDPLAIETMRKIDRCIADKECLIASYFLPGSCNYIGWLYDNSVYKAGWAPAKFGVWQGAVGFCHEEGSFHDRISGDQNGDSCDNTKLDLIANCWIEAGNTVQWRRRRAS